MGRRRPRCRRHILLQIPHAGVHERSLRAPVARVSDRRRRSPVVNFSTRPDPRTSVGAASSVGAHPVWEALLTAGSWPSVCAELPRATWRPSYGSPRWRRRRRTREPRSTAPEVVLRAGLVVGWSTRIARRLWAPLSRSRPLSRSCSASTIVYIMSRRRLCSFATGRNCRMSQGDGDYGVITLCCCIRISSSAVPVGISADREFRHRCRRHSGRVNWNAVRVQS